MRDPENLGVFLGVEKGSCEGEAPTLKWSSSAAQNKHLTTPMILDKCLQMNCRKKNMIASNFKMQWTYLKLKIK